PSPTSDTHSTPRRLKTPALPCTGRFRHDELSRPRRHMIVRERLRVSYKPDAQKRHARRFPRRRTSTPSLVLSFDRKTDRELPCRAAHTSPATNQLLKPREYSRLPAASSHRCSRETELQSASDGDHVRDAEGKQHAHPRASLR